MNELEKKILVLQGKTTAINAINSAIREDYNEVCKSLQSANELGLPYSIEVWTEYKAVYDSVIELLTNML